MENHTETELAAQRDRLVARVNELEARLTTVHRMPQDNLTPAEVRLGQYRRPPRTFETGSERDLYDIASGLQTALEETRDQCNAARLRAAELEEQQEWRRAHLVALQNDALDMRGSLSPSGQKRKVPFPLGKTLTPAVDWLINRVTELEVAALEGRAALAALCHDLEDPGSNAFGALFLLQQATPGTPMEPGEPTPTVYRASHDSIQMGLYTTAAEARRHCETLIRRDIPGASLDWIEDEEDDVAELVAAFGEDERSTGYVVTALEIAASYDEGADE